MYIASEKDLSKYAGKRKHGTQLQKFEETGLWKRLKTVQEWEWMLIDHAVDRIQEKGIQATRRDIIQTIHNANIIEYKIDYSHKTKKFDERVVLRSKAVIQGRYNLHAVYSLTEKKIVSVWTNRVNDLHRTLDWSQYDKNMKVFV